MGVIGVTVIFTILLFAVPQIIIFWKLMKKAGKAGWSQIIPAYSYYVQGIVAKKPTLTIWLGAICAAYFITSFTPLRLLANLLAIASLVLWIIQIIELSKQYDASGSKWVLFILLPIVGVFFVGNIRYIGATATPAVAPIV